MKNILIALVLATSLVSFNPINKVVNSSAKIVLACKFGQCQATAKSTGKQCKHCVSNDGDTYCFQHK